MQGLPSNLISGVVGGLVAAYFVHLLTKSRDHASWVRDSRMKEWQGLLETLSKAYMTRLKDPYVFNNEDKAQYNLSQANALADVEVMLATRIFISDDVMELDVRMKWAAMVNAFLPRTDKPSFMNAYQALHKDIVAKAKRTR
jgi:hypothetical protein